MHVNLMGLINSGKIGDSLQSRGGDRHRYMNYIFIKVDTGIVKVWDIQTWMKLDQTTMQDTKPPLATLTLNQIRFNLESAPINEHHQNVNQFEIWPMQGFLSLNLLHGVWFCNRKGTYLLRYDGVGTKDILTLPYGRMKFDWSGKMISPIPKYIVKKYAKWVRKMKDERNADSRARYAQHKTERVFKKHRTDNTLDQWDPQDVFKLKNARLRQQAIEAVGIENVLKDCPTVIIDTNTVDGRPYELIEVEIPTMIYHASYGSNTISTKKCLYLKMLNPSTGEYHLEGVARKSDNRWDYVPEETVLGALAWRDGENAEESWNGVSKSEDWNYLKPIVIT